ncbi:hypothetical protein QBC42DRAFT_314200 [Cladorrhinum samala]|uniref:Uncharacterized protein n=1 Tax=Cladorrhinum samala TaxID=585594 RepID=A0AAV9HEP1_9PEZI|nr:hypothetical protein QBC42DRAFT_314200 [Cladorrhinum samala]
MSLNKCEESQVIARTLKSLEYEAKEQGVTLPSAKLPLPEFLSALKKCGLPIYSTTFGTFLSGETALSSYDRFEKHDNKPLPVPCTADQARAFLAVFPLSTLDWPASAYENSAMGPSFHDPKYQLRGERSADLLVPLSRWPKDDPERLEIARLLLENDGADPNGHEPVYHCWCYTPSELAYSPLHIAAGTGDKEMVELLLEFGADKEKKDGNAKTAEDMARAKSKVDVVKLLEGWHGVGDGSHL